MLPTESSQGLVHTALHNVIKSSCPREVIPPFFSICEMYLACSQMGVTIRRCIPLCELPGDLVTQAVIYKVKVWKFNHNL